MAAAPIHVVIDGLLASALTRIADLVITDVLNEEPNTATLTVNQVPHAPDTAAFYPPAFDAGAFVTTPVPTLYPAIRRGQPIEIYRGTLAPDARLFAGEIVVVQQLYEGDRPELVAYHLSCTDYTRALNRRKVLKSYLTQSATAIVLDLMASRAADGFTTQFVAPNLPAVAIDFTFEEMNRALTRLANRIGGYWYVDYTKALHFFLEEPGDVPAALVPGECFADLRVETDLSQVRTRVLVEGMGSAVSTVVGPGETVIPVRTAVMFPTTGGQAVIGQQRLTYTGVLAGGAGSLVGPGAAPTVAPVAEARSGAGIEAGTHAYAISWYTAAGETLPSPPVTVTLGPLAPPAAGPTAGAPTVGTGPEPGLHYYALTFVTASGETTHIGGAAVTTQPPPHLAPLGPTEAMLQQAAGGLANGVAYRYQTTIVTADGESLPGPAGAAITSQVPAPPVWLLDDGAHGPAPAMGGALDPTATYTYWLTYVIGGTFESGVSPAFYYGMIGWTSTVWPDGFRRSADARVTGRKLYRSVANGSTPRLLATFNHNNATSYTDVTADGALGAARVGLDPIGTAPGNQAVVSLPTTSDPRADERRLYRSDAGAAFRRLATIPDLAATEYLDSTASVASNPLAPTVDTSGGAPLCVVPLADVAIGPPAVTGRRLYRTAANAPLAVGSFRLVTTIANNTATTYTDTLPDASLGAGLPATNTAVVGQVFLSQMATGPAAVLGRRLYRTTANSTALKLLGPIADNVTTTVLDGNPDSALSATVPPTADTSGLQQPQGQVTAGATVIPVAGTAPFAPTGGYAVVGNGEQVIRYTGVTAGSLTGIPASGPGALRATVAYNASITVSPALTGVSGIARALIDGEEIYLLVVRDDAAAQAALAAIEGGDGIIEHFVQDRRLSAAGATVTADAELALFATPEIRVTYTTRDPLTRTGKLVAINLPAPTNLVGSFLIQRVQLSRFHVPALAPLRTVQASSTRFSFDDVLRRLQFEVTA
jgi:hypothetical protein